MDFLHLESKRGAGNPRLVWSMKKRQQILLLSLAFRNWCFYILVWADHQYW